MLHFIKSSINKISQVIEEITFLNTMAWYSKTKLSLFKCLKCQEKMWTSILYDLCFIFSSYLLDFRDYPQRSTSILINLRFDQIVITGSVRQRHSEAHKRNSGRDESVSAHLSVQRGNTKCHSRPSNSDYRRRNWLR